MGSWLVIEDNDKGGNGTLMTRIWTDKHGFFALWNYLSLTDHWKSVVSVSSVFYLYYTKA